MISKLKILISAYLTYCMVVTSMIIIALSSTIFSQYDSSKQVLTFKDYLDQVKNHHPVAIQANLQLDMGDAEILSARGQFDPQLYMEIAQKYFKGDQYYSLMNGGLLIPTWFGIEFYAGYENNRGLNVNPQYYTPDAGLAYAGISIPIGQGLLIDKRRAELRKAQIYQGVTVENRRIILNDLLLEASDAYWSWFEKHNVRLVYLEALELAQERLDAIKRSAFLGDIPFIDTLEAGIQVQNRQISLQQTNIELYNARALLSVYLWQSGVIPVELHESVIPPNLNTTNDISPYTSPPLNIEEALDNHPEILRSQLKIDQLNIDRRVSLELIKPQLNLRYNAINQPIGSNPLSEYSIRNYTWGADFSIPIFLRHGRGELKLANLYLQDAALDLETKKAILKTKVMQASNEWSISNQQLELYEKTVRDLERLLIGEQTKFFAGESSLFMVNSRETNFISAQVLFIELTVKNQKTLMKTYHSLGLLVG